MRYDKIITKKGFVYRPIKCSLIGNYSMVEGETLEMTLGDGVIRSPSDRKGIVA